MILNDLGTVVETEWLKTKSLRTNVELDYFVVMPNHFHGILIINSAIETPDSLNVKTPYMVSLPLGDIVGKFKVAVTRCSACPTNFRIIKIFILAEQKFYNK